MTLNAKIRVFVDFFVYFGLRDTFQERIAPNLLYVDQDKLHTKFLALNVDFKGLSFNLLGSRKPAHENIKERYPIKVVILPLLACLP